MNNHRVTAAHDLVTTLEARRSGFLEYALRCNQESIPFIDRAKALKAILEAQTRYPRDILDLPNIRASLLEAAGVSVKAKAHLSEADQAGLLHDFIEKVLIPCADAYIEEIVYRYLLTAGDALGGKMRNITGSIAKEKLIRFVISQLQVSGFKFSCLTRTFQVLPDKAFSIDQIEHIKAIRWIGDSGQKRVLIYDTNVPQVKKNIDIVLLVDRLPSMSVKTGDIKQQLGNGSDYLAIGELKGGIDPAGADEHWKTANSALGRVRDAFQSKLPLCFIGAAIESAMAAEIFAQYQSGQLSNCANLTNDDQLAALCIWLVRL